MASINIVSDASGAPIPIVANPQILEEDDLNEDEFDGESEAGSDAGEFNEETDGEGEGEEDEDEKGAASTVSTGVKVKTTDIMSKEATTSLVNFLQRLQTGGGIVPMTQLTTQMQSQVPARPAGPNIVILPSQPAQPSTQVPSQPQPPIQQTQRQPQPQQFINIIPQPSVVSQPIQQQQQQSIPSFPQTQPQPQAQSQPQQLPPQPIFIQQPTIPRPPIQQPPVQQPSIAIQTQQPPQVYTQTQPQQPPQVYTQTQQSQLPQLPPQPQFQQQQQSIASSIGVLKRIPSKLPPIFPAVNATVDSLLVKSDKEGDDFFSLRSQYARAAHAKMPMAIPPHIAVLLGEIAANMVILKVEYPDDIKEALRRVDEELRR